MMDEVLTTHIRGRHASSESLTIVQSEGKVEAIRNLDTRITPETTEVKLASAYEGTVCLRVDDKKRHDFWIELNLDAATLERLLTLARESKQGQG